MHLSLAVLKLTTIIISISANYSDYSVATVIAVCTFAIVHQCFSIVHPLNLIFCDIASSVSKTEC